jgi:virulence factor Mce-like protein
LEAAVKRVAVAVVVGALALSACSLPGGHGSSRRYDADFRRAVQVFPAVKVRVLGVEVGHVVNVRNVTGGVDVSFVVTDPNIQLPRNVQAAVVPMSLLGERYIQLFPAYRGGPTLPSGSTIPMSRTAVPAEPDELIRGLQNYLGGLDPKTVTAFVENAARTLNGNGADLNRLIQYGADVIQTLSSKGNDLDNLISQFDTLTTALSTRQQALAQLITTYDSVATTVNENRVALEGTIAGLNAAAVQLAQLLTAHQKTLEPDIQTLTRTGQTLNRNIDTFAQTGHYATMLFMAATRAADYDHQWLRLGNQGQELGALILMRMEEDLISLCINAGILTCSTPQYWSVKVPQLFCFSTKGCGSSKVSAARALALTVKSVPKLNALLSAQASGQHVSLQRLIQTLLDSTVGDPGYFAPSS